MCGRIDDQSRLIELNVVSSNLLDCKEIYLIIICTEFILIN